METKTENHSLELHAQEEEHPCPECNTNMIAVEQRKENGFLFIWHECPVDNCDGQWLEKKL